MNGDSVTIDVNLLEMSSFASYNVTSSTIKFSLKDTGIGAGFFTAVIALYDWKDFTPYTLYVAILENDDDTWVNSAPYFENWAEEMPIKLHYGSLEEYTFVMPTAYDDDFEEVTIDINMDNID